MRPTAYHRAYLLHRQERRGMRWRFLPFFCPAFFHITKLLETLAEITNQLPYEQRLREKTSTGI
jgi:hypothetical protein